MTGAIQSAAMKAGDVNAATDCAVLTESLSKRFGKMLAVDSVNLRIPRGCTYGLIGLNGAGKSTVIRMLMGLLPPTSGRVLMRGLDPQMDPVEAKLSVGYVPDRPMVYPWMRIDEAMWFCKALQPKWNDAYAGELVKRLRLDVTKRIGKFSKGTAAKVSLLLALAHDPEVLILDEPTDGLDPVARDDFLEGVLASVCEHERTVLMSSHALSDVQRMADWIGLMHDGKLMIQCPTEELVRTTKRIKIVLPDGAAPSTPPPGTILDRREGRQRTITVREFTPQSTAGMTGDQIAVEDLSLDDIFKDFIRGQQEAEA